MIQFGAWSTILGLAAVFGVVVAGLLVARSKNRTANRLLAMLIAVAVLRLMPYVLGFAGFYDAFPWLSFAPFDFALAIGPLLYLYLRRLVTPALPALWPLHFLPAALDLGYTLWAFMLPLDAKMAWNDGVHVHWIDPLETAAAIVSLATYLMASLRLRRRYRDWLRRNVSDLNEHRQPWIGTVLGALTLWLVVVVSYDAVDRLFGHLTYRARFPEYLVFAGIVFWLGLEGWRHADHVFPPMIRRAEGPAAPGKDWPALGAAWAARIGNEGWWREPGLSLSDVAQRLATNESYVSKALNEGLGRNFNAVVNGFRVEAMKASLLDRREEILTLALDAGFASKASLNRTFREMTGSSPSAWRAAQISKMSPNTAFEATARSAES